MTARLAIAAAALTIALGVSWLWPRIQAAPTTHQIALGLLDEGRPNDALVLFEDRTWRGVAEYRAGRYDRAIGEFFPAKSALELYNIGTTLAQLEDWNGATANFEKVLRLDPTHADARHNLALMRQAAALDPDDELASSEESPLRQGDGDVRRDASDELPDPLEQSLSGDSDTEGTRGESNSELGGTAETPGELGDDEASGRVGTANAAGDPEQSPDGALRQGPGTGELKARESAQTAEILLRAIEDDPNKVLRMRLFTEHERRQGAAQ
jgi:Ca-activated chloride channel family protein